MNRRMFAGILASGAVLGLVPSVSFAEGKKKKNATIVLPITVNKDKSRDEVKTALNNVVKAIQDHAGLIDEQLMEGKYDRPNFVHISVWEKQTDWEALFADPKFVKVIEDNSDILTIQTADVYRPVKFK